MLLFILGFLSGIAVMTAIAIYLAVKEKKVKINFESRISGKDIITSFKRGGDGLSRVS